MEDRLPLTAAILEPLELIDISFNVRFCPDKIKSKLKCAMIFFFKKVANKERIFLLLFDQCEGSAQTLLQGGKAGLANRKLFLFWSPGPVKVHSVFLALLCALYWHSTDPGAL